MSPVSRRIRNAAVAVAAGFLAVASFYALQPKATNSTVSAPDVSPSARAASCWTTPHTWSSETITDALLNGTRDLLTCLKTEINDDGTITRDYMLSSSTTVAGNSGGAATVVNSYTMPAGTVSINGSALVIESGFVCAANGNTKTVEFLLGTTAITASSSACNGTVLIVRLTVIRAGATSQKVYGTTSASGLGAGLFANDSYAETLANALAVNFRLTGTATNDLQQSWVTIRHTRHS
jgi:hypothetical protein